MIEITDAMVQAGAKALNPIAFEEVDNDHLCDVVGARREARREARAVIVAALTVYVNEVDFVIKWSVGCGDCNCDMDVCEDTPADATVEWNTRAVPQSPWRPAVEALVSECVNPGDGGPFERGEWPALDAVKDILSDTRPLRGGE